MKKIRYYVSQGYPGVEVVTWTPVAELPYEVDKAMVEKIDGVASVQTAVAGALPLEPAKNGVPYYKRKVLLEAVSFLSAPLNGDEDVPSEYTDAVVSIAEKIKQAKEADSAAYATQQELRAKGRDIIAEKLGLDSDVAKALFP